MTSFELSKLQGISATRALSDTDRSPLDTRSRAVARTGEASGAKPGVALEINGAINGAINGTASGVIDPSQPPVDTDRVSEIRKALRDGTYPLVPTRIADAIIAARVGFGVQTRDQAQIRDQAT